MMVWELEEAEIRVHEQEESEEAASDRKKPEALLYDLLEEAEKVGASIWVSRKAMCLCI